AVVQSFPLSLHDALPISVLCFFCASARQPEMQRGEHGGSPRNHAAPVGADQRAQQVALPQRAVLTFSLSVLRPTAPTTTSLPTRSEEHTSELQSPDQLLC